MVCNCIWLFIVLLCPLDMFLIAGTKDLLGSGDNPSLIAKKIRKNMTTLLMYTRDINGKP